MRRTSRFATTSRLAAVLVIGLLALLLPLTGQAGAQHVGAVLDPAVEREVLVDDLITPTALEVAPDGRAIITSREGQIHVWEQDGTVTRAAHLDVDAYDRSGDQFDESACPRGEECPAGYNLAEGGIHGILLAPDFPQTGHLYLYYTVADSLGAEIWPPKHLDARPWCAPVESPTCLQDEESTQPNQHPENLSDEGKFRLSRFTLDLATNQLDPASEVPLFENPAEWFYCCHYGGDLEWLNDGTLALTTGDDTSSDHSDQYSPHDERSDHTWNSAALTSQNPADRRGKVLRIDVAELVAAREAGVALEDGWDDPATDGIPGDRGGIEPNPPVAEVADPYVYAMGFRSNYRFAHNPHTDHLYVGTVGPDARAPDPNRGPAAHEELEVVPPGGGTNHGWPHCIADNIPYHRYDFETGTAGEAFDCSTMTPAAIYYTYNPSPTSPYAQVLPVPINTILGGTTYFRPDTGALRLPALYDSSVLWLEHGRGAMYRTAIDEDGTLDTAVPSTVPVIQGGPSDGQYAPWFANPIDATVGPDGAVYVVEGNGFWNSVNGRLSRLKCTGCQPDPADYGDDVVAATVSDVAVAAVGGDAAELPAWLLVGLGLFVATAVAVARRRRVV